MPATTMSYLDLIIPVTIFGLSAVSTPGPNNIMLTASGVNFGFRRTVPHILGIAIGFAVMNLAVGVGLGGVFEAYPTVHMVLKYVCAVYLMYLAFRIATAGEAKTGKARAKPFTFLQAAAFQWVNPKAWAIVVSAVATFTSVGGDLFAEVLLMSVIFLIVTFPSASSWTFFGTVIARYLHNPARLRAFNLTMAALLMLSLVPVLV